MKCLEEVLASLTAERYDQRWWPGVHPNPPHDDEATCARRRREALADSTSHREESHEHRTTPRRDDLG